PHRGHRGVERADAADRVVDLRGRAVEGDLDVEVIVRGQAPGDVRRDPHAVGRELHADPVRGRVVEQIQEILSNCGLTTADVHVEHLHAFQFVDHRLALGGAQLARIPAAGAGQAVDAGQVAGIGQLPGQADGSVQAECELLD